ncbi:CHASE domain-containing protein [Novilysobacter arseniciresistens]|uniref:CHASE domain-containing protein n=1 Tax=Novilysobacter arseniciresistens TaxID=1385522 RepID=UPI00068CC528|nr:CHASE domain-containing protein [Lysobacter arseniciresistens]
MDDLPGTDPPRSLGERLRPLRGHLWALVVLVASLVTVLALWRAAYDRELRAADARFVASTQEAAELLKQRIINYELVAGGGAALFASVDRPTPSQWYGFAEGLGIDERFPGMVGLGFAGYVSGNRLLDLQTEWREAGWGVLRVRPGGARDHYGPILYLEPRSPENVAAIGFDMYSEPTRHRAMQSAMERGIPTLSGPVQLVQDGDTPLAALLLYVPVYRDGARPATPETRQAAMLGWVYVPFRMERFVEEALGDNPMRFSITDVSSGETPLYATALAGDGQPAFRHEIQVEHYGRRWLLAFESAPLEQAAPRLASLQTILALGLFASLLMYAIAWMLAQTESRAQKIALGLTENYRRSEERFRTAMQYSAIGKVLLDSHGCIVEANPAFAGIVGRSAEALVGAGFQSLFEDAGADADDTGTPEPRETGIRRETRRLHRDGGEPRLAQLTYSPVPGSIGQDVVGLVQAEDVTERLQAEARVHALNRTLEHRVALRTRELSQANQELEAFAYSVSHDLRAPLRAIDGFSKVLAERYAGSLDESGQGYLERVRKAANRMGELIDALLKMSRVTRSPIHHEFVDLSRIAAEVVEELRTDDAGHPVDVAIQPGLEAEGDASLLRNLLANLLGNAWKFTRGADRPHIEFGRNAVEFYVRDNGAGFDPEYVDKLFRPFQRLHDQNEFAGHGIGLASVKRIVERHGGTIRAEGRPGQGATFYFTLPGEVREQG